MACLFTLCFGSQAYCSVASAGPNFFENPFGLPDGYEDYFNQGYSEGYGTGYDLAYQLGSERGTQEGTSTGQEEGHDKGWSETYQPAFNLAYDEYVPLGREDGYNIAYEPAFDKGYQVGYEVGFERGQETIYRRYLLPLFQEDQYYSGTLYVDGTSIRGGGGNSTGLVITNSARLYLSPSLAMGIYIGEYFIDSTRFTDLTDDEDLLQRFFEIGHGYGTQSGQADGDTEGYETAYQTAYDAAYGAALVTGRQEGEAQGSIDGAQEGYTTGFDLGEALGEEEGHDTGYDLGLAEGYDAGRINALTEAGFREKIIPDPIDPPIIPVPIFIGEQPLFRNIYLGSNVIYGPVRNPGALREVLPTASFATSRPQLALATATAVAVPEPSCLPLLLTAVILCASLYRHGFEVVALR